MQQSNLMHTENRGALCPVAFLVIAVALMMELSALGQVPQRLHYQGYLTNAVGDPIDCPNMLLCSTPYDIQFRIYSTSTGGGALWTEIHSVVPILNGIFQVELGVINPLEPNILVGGPRWLGVEINGNGEMLPRQAILSAAYAIQADHANTADNANKLGGIPPADFALLADIPEFWPILDFFDIDPSGNLAYNGNTVISATGDWLGSPSGLVGPQGPTGAPGQDGLDGATGATGATGSPGASPFTLNGSDAVYMDGGVLIGLGESPSWKFVVQGAGGALGHVGAFSSNQEVAYLGVISAQEARYLYTHDDGRFGIHIPGVGDLLTILGNGNVGIGNTEPQQKLDVAGSIQADGIYFPDGSSMTTAPGGGGGASVMVLKHTTTSSGSPANCPSGWSQADYQQVVSGGYLNWERTCYRADKLCTTMYLRHTTTSSGSPANCPGGWSEADYQKEVIGGYLNWVRTCYRCP